MHECSIGSYELYLAVEDIDHTRTKTKSPQTNGTRPLAASVTESPSGSRHWSRMISPGCWIMHSRHRCHHPSRSVVIRQIDIGYVRSVDPRVAPAMDEQFLSRWETDAPVAGYRNCPLASSVAP
jgi:hypothetical protein